MKKLHIREPFVLESGEVLPQIEISYHTFGQLNKDTSNVVWVFHALTGNADPLEWWPGVVGDTQVIDPQKHFIVCANVLGSCYGSTNASSIDPKTGKAYQENFPFISIRDMVKAHQLLQKHLGLYKIKLGIGGSMGGQQLLEWAISDPSLFEDIVLIATNARFSAWGIAFNESQRMAIHADLQNKQEKEEGKEGLKAARAIAMLSYRSYETYDQSQQEQNDEKTSDFKASSYQQYQGEKFWNRFDVYAYLTLTKAMDSHHVGRHRGGIAQALQAIQARTLIIGISSDVLFPIQEQKQLYQYIKEAQLLSIDSPYGHDGFLVETEKISAIIADFLAHKAINQGFDANATHKAVCHTALPGSESF